MVQKAGGGQDSGFMVRMGVISKPTLEGVRLALQVFGEAGSRQRAKLTRRL